MTVLMRRRRGMIQDNDAVWELIPFSMGGWRPGGNVHSEYNSDDGTLHVYLTGNAPWSGADATFHTQSGYDYKIECDVTVAAGLFRIAARASNSILYGSDITDHDACVSFRFPHNSSINKLSIFPAYGLSNVLGDVTVSNFTIWRRKND